MPKPNRDRGRLKAACRVAFPSEWARASVDAPLTEKTSGGTGIAFVGTGIERLFLEPVAQRAKRDAEELGGLRAHATRPLERLQEQPALDLTQDFVQVAPFLRQLHEARRGCP